MAAAAGLVALRYAPTGKKVALSIPKSSRITSRIDRPAAVAAVLVANEVKTAVISKTVQLREVRISMNTSQVREAWHATRLAKSCPHRFATTLDYIVVVLQALSLIYEWNRMSEEFLEYPRADLVFARPTSIHRTRPARRAGAPSGSARRPRRSHTC
jgi:hypothetical protein